MRVLIVHPGFDYSVADVHTGWRDALVGLGLDVRSYDLNDRLVFYAAMEIGGEHLAFDDVCTLASKGLEGKCYEFDPDVVIVISGFFIAEAVWKAWARKRVKVVLLCTESPYEDDRQCALVEQYAPDLVIVNDPINLDDYRNIHSRTYYIPHSYDPKIHHPGLEAPKVDFTWVGTAYPSRIEFFEAIDWSGITPELRGNWKRLSETSPLLPFVMHPLTKCCDNADTVRAYQGAKISANLYRAGRNADDEANTPSLATGWAMGPREVELSACETFMLRESRGEGDQVLHMLPTFTEPGDFAEQLRYFLSHDGARCKAAAQARAAIQDRTFDVHARRMLRLLPD